MTIGATQWGNCVPIGKTIVLQDDDTGAMFVGNVFDPATGVETIMDMTGFHGSPDPTVSFTQVPGASGATSGPSYDQQREITLTGMIEGPSWAIGSYLDSLRLALSKGYRTLKAPVLGGMVLATQVRRSGGAVMDGQWDPGTPGAMVNIPFSVQLTAEDPRLYGDLQTADVPMLGSPPQVTVNNAGTEPTPVRIVLTGPLQGMSIDAQLADGTTKVFTCATLFGPDAGQQLVINMDPRFRTVYLVNDGPDLDSRRNLISDQWFMLPPGNNVMTFSWQSGREDATAIQVQWRSAWL